MTRRSSFAFALFLFVALTLNACGGGDSPSEVRGVITNVTANEIIKWESITVRDAEGKQFTFLRGESVDLIFWRASHLREHMGQGESITVTYTKTSAGLVATKISD